MTMTAKEDVEQNKDDSECSLPGRFFSSDKGILFLCTFLGFLIFLKGPMGYGLVYQVALAINIPFILLGFFLLHTFNVAANSGIAWILLSLVGSFCMTWYYIYLFRASGWMWSKSLRIIPVLLLVTIMSIQFFFSIVTIQFFQAMENFSQGILNDFPSFPVILEGFHGFGRKQ